MLTPPNGIERAGEVTEPSRDWRDRSRAVNFLYEFRWPLAAIAAGGVISSMIGGITGYLDGRERALAEAHANHRGSASAPAVPGGNQAVAPSPTWSTNPNEQSAPTSNSGVFNTAPAAGNTALACTGVAKQVFGDGSEVLAPIMAGDTASHKLVTIRIMWDDRRFYQVGVRPTTVTAADLPNLAEIMVIDVAGTPLAAMGEDIEKKHDPFGTAVPDGSIYPCELFTND
ncbi:MAG TPA: hypothetical protein VIR03_01320 [Candidatus Saccharimonadales bacterium]